MHSTKAEQQVVGVFRPDGKGRSVLVCEHASSYIPPEFDCLGLTPDLQTSHAAWDPGALALALRLSDRLDVPLVAGGVSRLVYDCNRPPSAPDAMPARSEVIAVPGNENLSTQARRARAARYYEPFRRAVAQTLDHKSNPVLVTIHSFTPIYHGQPRATEIGVLHDADTRLADALLASPLPGHDVRRNEPYGPQNGVTHTLKEHALPHGYLNVMLEVRNDLLRTENQQDRMADAMAGWITSAIETSTNGNHAA